MNNIKLNRERLIERREKLGLSKREAAKQMHLSQPAYLRYESGERNPSIHVIQTMAEILSTSVNYLIGESDDSTPDCFYIRRTGDSELFEIVKNYKNDDATKERLLEYFHKLHS